MTRAYHPVVVHRNPPRKDRSASAHRAQYYDYYPDFDLPAGGAGRPAAIYRRDEVLRLVNTKDSIMAKRLRRAYHKAWSDACWIIASDGGTNWWSSVRRHVAGQGWWRDQLLLLST
jgi:hypothetical protein